MPNDLSFWDLFNLVGIVYRVTGKWVFDGHFTSEDFGALLLDEEFVNLLKKLLGGE